jgi:hypothetical protein
MSMKNNAARFGCLLALTLGLALVSLPVRAQDMAGTVEICEGNEKIPFHNPNSGYRLEAHCQGKIRWTISIIGDVVVDEFNFITFTLATEDGTITDASIAVAGESNLVQRQLHLVTKNNDKMTITFKVDKVKKKDIE